MPDSICKGCDNKVEITKHENRDDPPSLKTFCKDLPQVGLLTMEGPGVYTACSIKPKAKKREKK